jgi:hypothetical protein
MAASECPTTYEDLCKKADALRPKIQDDSAGMRWCWIAYHRDGDYYLGVQFEGQSWWRNCGLLQQGSGETALEWVTRLNEREGLSEEAVSEISESYSLNARAALNEDETAVILSVTGRFPEWDVAPSSREMAREYGEMPEFPSAYPEPIRIRSIFTLDVDLSNDLAGHLDAIAKAGHLPKPSDTIPDIEVIQDEKSGDTTFFVPGRMEFDSLDEARFTVAIDLQTAADLLQVINDEFCY